MARIPKEKPRKEPRRHIIDVPLVVLMLDRTEDEELRCDKCHEVPDDPDNALFTIGVTEQSTLGLAHFCKPCFDSLEWGQVYAPGRGFGTPCIPVGAN